MKAEEYYKVLAERHRAEGRKRLIDYARQMEESPGGYMVSDDKPVYGTPQPKLLAKKKVQVVRPGGGAGSGTLAYRVPLPAEMARILGITKENREVYISMEDGVIKIWKA